MNRALGLRLLLPVLLATSVLSSRADRILLSPEGNTLPAKGFKAEFVSPLTRGAHSMSWYQVSNAQSIEFEAERSGAGSRFPAPYALNVQYPLIPDFGRVPAISLGVRDLLGTGREHRAFYLAITRGVSLSDRQLRLVRDVKLNIGAGTGRLDGPFIGARARLTAGVSLAAELYRRRPNYGVSFPVARYMQAKAYSLGGRAFYGLSLTVAR